VIFKTYDLGDIKNGGFELSKQVEEEILKIVGKRMGKPTRVDLTEGKNVENDGWIGDKRAEVKVSAKVFKGDLKYGNFFETHYKNGQPSALLLTESELYVTLSPGWSSKQQMMTGKIRVWEVKDLLSVMGRVYPIVKFDYDEYGFYIPNKSEDIKHLWVGDVLFNPFEKEYNLGVRV
jgi:hypothetical protein